MQDSTLLKISLVTSIIGLVGLFLILQFSKLDESNIFELEDIVEGDTIRIIGIVNSVNNKNNFTFISILQEKTVEGVIFDDINLSKNQKVEVIGKLSEYNNKKEIIIDRLEIIS